MSLYQPIIQHKNQIILIFSILFNSQNAIFFQQSNLRELLQQF